MVTDQKNHASRHSDGGSDELDAADLSGASGTSGQVLQSDGSAASWVDFSSGASVSDGGTEVLGSPTDVNYGSNLEVVDDGDGTVTVDASGGGLSVYDDSSLVKESSELRFDRNLEVFGEQNNTLYDSFEDGSFQNRSGDQPEWSVDTPNSYINYNVVSTESSTGSNSFRLRVEDVGGEGASVKFSPEERQYLRPGVVLGNDLKSINSNRFISYLELDSDSNFEIEIDFSTASTPITVRVGDFDYSFEIYDGGGLTDDTWYRWEFEVLSYDEVAFRVYNEDTDTLVASDTFADGETRQNIYDDSVTIQLPDFSEEIFKEYYIAQTSVSDLSSGETSDVYVDRVSYEYEKPVQNNVSVGLNVDKPVDFSEEKLTGVASPSNGLDAANKSYVDSSVSGKADFRHGDLAHSKSYLDLLEVYNGTSLENSVESIRAGSNLSFSASEKDLGVQQSDDFSSGDLSNYTRNAIDESDGRGGGRGGGSGDAVYSTDGVTSSASFAGSNSYEADFDSINTGEVAYEKDVTSTIPDHLTVSYAERVESSFGNTALAFTAGSALQTMYHDGKYALDTKHLHLTVTDFGEAKLTYTDSSSNDTDMVQQDISSLWSQGTWHRHEAFLDFENSVVEYRLYDGSDNLVFRSDKKDMPSGLDKTVFNTAGFGYSYTNGEVGNFFIDVPYLSLNTQNTTFEDETVLDAGPSVRDNGSEVAPRPTDLNFASNLDVTDDGDGTVTVDASGGGSTVDSIDPLIVSTPPSANGTNSFAAGNNAVANGENSVVIGNGAIDAEFGTPDSAVAIGDNVNAVLDGVAIGSGVDGSLTAGGAGVGIGQNAKVGANSVAIGVGASTGEDNLSSIALGPGAVAQNSHEMRVAGNGSGLDVFVENSSGTDVQIFNSSTGEVVNTQEKVAYETGHTAWADGLNNEEVHRIVLQSGETLNVERIEFRQKGGGSSTSASVDVYDNTAASVIGSQNLGGTTKNPGSSGTGNTVLVRVNNSTGGSINASIRVIGYIEGA